MIGYYNNNLAYSYPSGVNPLQTASCDPINKTIIVKSLNGSVSGWFGRLMPPTVAAAIQGAADKVAYINNTLGFPSVTVVFVE